MVEVGVNNKRLVTKEDSDLFEDISEFMKLSVDNKKGSWHMGYEDIGNLATYIVENYKIEKLNKNKP